MPCVYYKPLDGILLLLRKSCSFPVMPVLCFMHLLSPRSCPSVALQHLHNYIIVLVFTFRFCRSTIYSYISIQIVSIIIISRLDRVHISLNNDIKIGILESRISYRIPKFYHTLILVWFVSQETMRPQVLPKYIPSFHEYIFVLKHMLKYIQVFREHISRIYI